MKLTTMTQVTIDGVMQGNGGRRTTAGTDSSAAAGRGARATTSTTTFINETYAARRRVPVRPADLRALRRLVGVPDDRRCPRLGAHLAGPEQPAQVRGVDHPRRPGVVGHHRPVR